MKYSLKSCYCSLFCILAHPPKVKYSLKSCYCSLFCILAHPPKVKYSLKSCYCILFCILALHPPKVLNLVLYIGTPSQSEIFSSQSCYCSLFCILALHTLPKWNILWKAVIVAYSVYWHTLPKWNSLWVTPSQSEIFSEKLLLYLVLYIGTPSQSEILFCILAHPPKAEILSEKLVIVAYCAYIGTPSQSEIFSWKAVIVSCSVYWHTLPKWNIILPKLLLYLVLYIGLAPSQSEIFSSQSCYCSLFCILAHPPKVKGARERGSEGRGARGEGRGEQFRLLTPHKTGIGYRLSLLKVTKSVKSQLSFHVKSRETLLMDTTRKWPEPELDVISCDLCDFSLKIPVIWSQIHQKYSVQQVGPSNPSNYWKKLESRSRSNLWCP